MGVADRSAHTEAKTYLPEKRVRSKSTSGNLPQYLSESQEVLGLRCVLETETGRKAEDDLSKVIGSKIHKTRWREWGFFIE